MKARTGTLRSSDPNSITGLLVQPLSYLAAATATLNSSARNTRDPDAVDSLRVAVEWKKGSAVHQPGPANSSHLMPGIRSALTSGGPSCHVWSCKGSSFALCLGSEWNWALRREAENNHTLPSVHQDINECAPKLQSTNPHITQ